MVERPTFSIIVPCFNYGHYLEETLQSIAIQQRPDIQVILVDDASTDNTPEIASRHKSWVSYIRNEKNKGAAGAWAVGLTAATGLYVMKLDADDKLLPGFCNAMQLAFEQDAEIGIAICSVMLLNEVRSTRKPQYMSEQDTVLNAEAFRKRFLKSFFFRMPGCMLRRSMLSGHELPDQELYQIHDWEYFLRVTKNNKAALLREPLAEYRIHGQSITATAQKNNRLFRDIQHWLTIAEQPGERFIEPDQLRILQGSLADLLLIGFGPKLKLGSYTNYFSKYLKAVGLAAKAGVDQVLRIHGVVFAKILRHLTFRTDG